MYGGLGTTWAERFVKPLAVSSQRVAVDPVNLPVTWDGSELARARQETGWSVPLGPNAAGTYCRLNTPADDLGGLRVADLNVALMRFLDAELGTELGEVAAAPDVRRR